MNSLLRYLLPCLLTACLGVGSAWAQHRPSVEVYKNPQCGCCKKWVEHLKENGFTVSVEEVTDVSSVRRSLGIPDQLASCHTAKVAGYLVEGHVPAADIQRLLTEKPKALGLAVPSMPPGSPGMESTYNLPYTTLLVDKDGSTHVFAKH